MDLSQLGGVHLPRDKGRMMRRKITELGIARHWEQKAGGEAGCRQRWEWGGGPGSSLGTGRVWQKGTCLSRGTRDDRKVRPATTTTTSPICLFAYFLFLSEDMTLPARMFTFKSLIQSQDIEFPAVADALSTFCYHHKELSPGLNVFSAGEKVLKKYIMNTLSPKF